MAANGQTLSAETVGLVLDAAGHAGVPVNLRGGPGIGKTAVVSQLAEARDRHLEIVLASVREPADFAGLPIVADGAVTALAPPRWGVEIERAGGGIVFFDEVNTATPAVQAALLRVITEGWVGDLKLPEDTWYVAAMNPVEIAAGGWDLAAPLANRFLHLSVEPNADVWMAGMISGWAGASRPVLSVDPTPEQRARVLSQITSFIAAKPEYLYALPEETGLASGAWPSPRTWDYLSRVLPRIPQEETSAILAVCAGLVGDRAATEFLTFVDQFDLPAPADLLNDPSLVDWAAERGDRALAALSSLVALVSQTGEVAVFEKTLQVLQIAVEAGCDDVAAAVVKPLMAAKPAGAKVDMALMAKFAPLLGRAGKVG